MKDKLTITIDSQLIPVAKQFARASGRSLSAAIEEAIRDLVGDSRGKKEPKKGFVDTWGGKLKLSASRDSRTEYLRKKY